MNLRKIQWHLITTKPCAEDILAPFVQSLSTKEIKICKVIEQYSCLVPFLRERLCYRAPVTSTERVSRPSYVITREQLEVMHSYGLPWVEIAKATRWDENYFHNKENVHAESFVFFFVMPLFSRMDVFSFLLINILKSFGHRYGCFILATGWSMFHDIRCYRVIKGVLYAFTYNTFRRGLDFVASIIKWKEESIMEEGS